MKDDDDLAFSIPLEKITHEQIDVCQRKRHISVKHGMTEVDYHIRFLQPGGDVDVKRRLALHFCTILCAEPAKADEQTSCKQNL